MVATKQRWSYLDRTRLGNAVSNLNGLRIRTYSDLHHLSDHTPDELARLGIDQTGARLLTGFNRLSGVFPPAVALALQEAGADSLEELKRLDGDSYAKALASSGISIEETTVERERFERWKAMAEAGEAPNGLTLDLGAGTLSAAARRTLSGAGIATLYDWAVRHDLVKLPVKSAALLDAHARLRAVGLWGDTASKLIGKGITSAGDLARLSRKSISRQSQRLGVSEALLEQIVSKAVKTSNEAADLLDGTMIAVEGVFPDWLSGILDVIVEYICLPCDPRNSAWSRFAYFVYLLQREDQAPDELGSRLKLGRDLKTFSPADGETLVPDPLAECAEISVLDLIIRTLQDDLIARRAAAKTTEERERLSFLSYDAWRAERQAFYFPELNALWRDDVLTGETGPWDRGSIIRDRARNAGRIEDQLESAEKQLKDARLSKGRPLDDFVSNPLLIDDPGATEKFGNTAFHQDVLRGLAAIRDVLKADAEVQKAAGQLDQFQPGLALNSLTKALGHLEAMAGRVFRPSSIWTKPVLSAFRAYDKLAAAAPKKRTIYLKALFEKLLTGPKAIFETSLDTVQSSLNSNLPGGQVESLSGWTRGDSFILAANNEPNLLGEVIKEYDHETSVTLRQCRYNDSGALLDCSLSVRLRWVTDQYERSNYSSKTDNERAGIGVRMSADGTKGYHLVIVGEKFTTPPNEDGESLTGYERFLILRKDNGDTVTELGRTSLLVEAGDLFEMAFEVASENGSTRLSGAAVYENGVVKELSAVDDAPLGAGTFALLASRSVGARFAHIVVEAKAISQVGAPPFHAPRRMNLGHDLEGAEIYSRREEELTGMAVRLDDPVLTRTARGVESERLAGVKASNGNDRYLLFPDGATAVSLDALDELLDRCLALSFYLRYAAIPTRMAQAFLQSGEFERSADLLHLLYDDTAPVPEARTIYPGFNSPPDSLIAGVSPDVRLLRLRIGEVYLAHAEWLFRQDTAESRHAARRLYKQVLAFHDGAKDCDCDSQIGTVVEEIIDRWLAPSRPEIPPVDLDDPDRFAGIITGIRDIGAKDPNVWKAVLDRLPDTGDVDPVPYRDTLAAIEGEISQAHERYHQTVSSKMTVEALSVRGELLMRAAELRAFGKRADDLGGPAGRSGKTRRLKRGWLTGYDTDYEWRYGTYSYDPFCIPDNPLKQQQRRTACLMLDLIRQCRNVLGFTQDLVPPLRFEALLQLSRSLAEQAHAAERDLLNFRQAFEQETFSLMQAQMNLALSEADLSLEALNRELAQGDIRLAALQSLQASNAVDHYQQLLDEGLSNLEKLAVDAAWASAVFSGISAGFSGLAALPALGGAVLAGVGLAQMGTGILTVPGAATTAAGLLATVAGGPQALASFSSSLAQAASATSSAAALQAGYERREQEWQYSLEQNQYGEAIARENLAQAERRFAIAIRREEIASIRRDFALDAVHFLSHKFLNGAMWVWLQRTIREQYRLRLNYAIATAFMAERALAFEIQNRDLRVIGFDYFDPKRDGLLGATQLQTDLSTLEQTKLSVTQRKLQLTRTLSLSQLMPVEFELLRQGSGILPFTTLQEWFDRDFPGHYMRIIAGIKMTVVALVPPLEGIRANLRQNGISRVVVGPPYQEGFSEKTIRRNPELIALSAPFQASGLFNFDFRDDLLRPFEGSGVAADWILELPKAANRFDFRTIADVLITIEYTALESSVYRQQVAQQLDPKVVAERPFSFRRQFADGWYDLNHPQLQSDVNQQMVVTFDTRRGDFPPNLEDLRIQHVTLFFARKEGFASEITVENFQFTPAAPADSTAIGGGATTVDGIISTRRSNGSAWSGMQAGMKPIGNWLLKLPNDSTVKNWFKEGKIEDILFVVTFAGTTPPY